MVSVATVRGMENNEGTHCHRDRRRWDGEPASAMCPVDDTCNVFRGWVEVKKTRSCVLSSQIFTNAPLQGGAGNSASALLAQGSGLRRAAVYGDVSGCCPGKQHNPKQKNNGRTYPTCIRQSLFAALFLRRIC